MSAFIDCQYPVSDFPVNEEDSTLVSRGWSVSHGYYEAWSTEIVGQLDADPELHGEEGAILASFGMSALRSLANEE